MAVPTRFAVLLACAALAGVPGRAQPTPARFACFGVDEGLPSASVTALLQDREGFLWVGAGHGLARFDGHTFRRYALPGETLGEVAALLEARDGTLWVGTNQAGLFRLDARTGRLGRASLPLDGVVGRIEEGPGGRLLVHMGPPYAHSHPNEPTRPLSSSRTGPSARDLWFYLDGTGHLRPFRPRPGVVVLDVYRDATHALWVLLADGSVFRHQPGDGRWVPIGFRGRSASAGPGSFFLTLGTQVALRLPDGTVWVQAPGGPFLQQVLMGAPSLHRLSTSHHSGDGLVLDGVWWDAYSHGLISWHPARGIRRYGPVPGDPHALPDTRVLSVAADRSGVLWVGTSSRGLCRLDPASAPLQVTSVLDLHRQVRADRLYTVYESPAGETFLGLEGDLLVRPAGAAAFRRFQPALPDSVRGFFSKAIYRDRHGTLWVSPWGGGLWRLDAHSGRWRGYLPPDPRGFDAGAARVLHEDRHGTLWVGSESGLRRFVRERDAFERPHRPGADSLVVGRTPVWALHEATDGTFWVGTYERGLCRFTPTDNRERCYSLGGTTRASRSVSAVLPGPGGTLWVGTYGAGLCRFDPTTSTAACLTEADGLLDDVVYAVLSDARGRLWASTQGGISRFDPASGAFENFRAARGATRLELANGVGARLRGGQLVFGGTGGLVRFHPDSAGARAYRPPVRLTSVRFFDREVLPDAPERAGRGLRVPPTERYVSFEFAALDLLAPERIRYRYRLDGFDPGWSEPSAARTATYTNLPPGKYTFHVQATNAAGVWNAAPLRVPVVVVPPLWRRAWFQGLAGLLLAGGFAATVRYASTRRLRARLRALEAERRVQAERLRISRDLHDHVGAQMATLLSAAELVRLSARAGDEAGAQRYAEVVTADAHEAMRQIRIAAASLRAEALTPAELAARIEADARTRLRLPSAPALHVSVRVDEACQEVPLPPERALHLQRIAEEAVTNVLRHAGASRLDVCLHVAPGRVRLMVQDDGRGFAADTPAPGDGRPAGSGLLNMHARARESGGHVTVRAVPGAGTAVEVEVPLR